MSNKQPVSVMRIDTNSLTIIKLLTALTQQQKLEHRIMNEQIHSVNATEAFKILLHCLESAPQQRRNKFK